MAFPRADVVAVAVETRVSDLSGNIALIVLGVLGVAAGLFAVFLAALPES